MRAIADRAPHPANAHLSRSDADDGDASRSGSRVVHLALHTLVENFEQGVAVVDRAGRPQFLNRAAHGLIAAGLLRLDGGFLCTATLFDGMTLQRFIAGCAAGRGSRSTRLVSENGTLLVAACVIDGSPGAAVACSVLLRFTDPAAARLVDRSVLQSQFGFTPSEAALAVDLLAGHDLASSASRRGTSANTARAHLRRIFEKTGTRRQAELMRLLLLCPQTIDPDA